jgi:coenzyme F420-reducing hydrogenase gamma subunit
LYYIDEVEPERPSFKLVFRNYTDGAKYKEIDIYDILEKAFGEEEALRKIRDFAGVRYQLPGCPGESDVSLSWTGMTNIKEDFNRMFEASLVNSKQLAAIKSLSEDRFFKVFTDFRNLMW